MPSYNGSSKTRMLGTRSVTLHARTTECSKLLAGLVATLATAISRTNFSQPNPARRSLRSALHDSAQKVRARACFRSNSHSCPHPHFPRINRHVAVLKTRTCAPSYDRQNRSTPGRSDLCVAQSCLFRASARPRESSLGNGALSDSFPQTKNRSFR
jgi:hypothetical protein